MIYENVLRDPDAFDFTVEALGDPSVPTTTRRKPYIKEDEVIAFSSQAKNIFHQIEHCKIFPGFEKAGPRELLFHHPNHLKAGIITCGGLCPGLNNVIKGLVKTLQGDYGVNNIVGIRYGYRGLSQKSQHAPIELNCDRVDHLHTQGGTILGSSRGNQDPGEMVDQLLSNGIGLLFCVGGDGTLRGAMAIANEVNRRKLPIGIIGIPKTIDNDLGFIEKTFGFETSVQIASEIITSAHQEAMGAENGIGIVKLMGRDSGFIAATATLANSVVDFCLIPEIELELDGERGLIEALKTRLSQNSHAVIVVAEGAGQGLFANAPERKDQSGNVLKEDIGVFLRDEINKRLHAEGISPSMKYLDPSYHIRSVPAIASDAVFCHLLAEHAVHAGMAGKTNMVVGHWNNFFTHIPISLATQERRMVDLDGALWEGILSATQQDELLG